MTENIEFVLRTIPIGVGATLVMDLWAAALRRYGIPSLDFALLGRWIGHLPDGQLRHASIAKAPPVRGERLLGWSAHYAIGLSFAALLLATFGLRWARSPSLLPALLVGVATVVAPLFVLQPALGAGAGFYNEAGDADPDLTTIEVSRFGVCLVGAPGLVAASQPPDWRALAELPWIYPTVSTCCGKTAENLFKAHQIRPKKIISIDREHVTRTLVAGSVGIGILHADTLVAGELQSSTKRRAPCACCSPTCRAADRIRW